MKLMFLTLFYFLNIIGVADEIPDEFKIKRKNNFEFVSKPVITKSKKGCVINFETKDFCDVTIVIEDSTNKIIRHLASGILGNNPPAPFVKNVKKQSVLWDGKDDQGKYRDDFGNLKIRVSLGLKPTFEKTLFWSPHKRIGNNKPKITMTKECVYISEGQGVDSLRQYDHDGNYIKTVYPFPAKNLDKIKGLNKQKFQQDGKLLPIKLGPKHRSTLLSSGSNMVPSPGKYGEAANTIAAHGDDIALISFGINRLKAEGREHPNGLVRDKKLYTIKTKTGKERAIMPFYSTFSNDGKSLYISGFKIVHKYPKAHEWVPGIYKIDYHNKSKPVLFKGSADPKKVGSNNDQFKVNLGICFDAKNRLYVADYMNDRIQVFKEDGTFLKSLKVKKPVEIGVDQRTGKIYIVSLMLVNKFLKAIKLPANVSILTSYENPKVESTYKLPLIGYNPGTSMNRRGGLEFSFAFDFHSKKPRLWMMAGLTISIGGWGVITAKTNLKGTGIIITEFEKNKLKTIKDFHTTVTKKIVRAKPHVHTRQRLYVNPTDGMLYLAEAHTGVSKSFNRLAEINPNNGSVKDFRIPITAEDMAIGLDGYFYLRTEYFLMRFDPKTWKEIPFDYGVEKRKVGFDIMQGNADAISAIQLPATGKGMAWWHLGGMAISPKGHIVLSCCNQVKRLKTKAGNDHYYAKRGSKNGGSESSYKPDIYPGRRTGWELHVWDKYGKPVYEDAFSGLYVSDGISMDKDDNLYVLMQQNRSFNGKPYMIKWAETMVKVKASKAKVITTFRPELPIEKAGYPKRKMDIAGAWVENAEWFYGGVGFNGGKSGSSCICWNARPALDLFARSFLPEIDHFSIAVLDSNGNLITRIGQYGNVDDGKPLVNAGGPKNTNSIGGDEVALFHAAYVATHSDKRLFIADAGNSRILSVKLNYHTNSTTALKGLLK